MPQSGGWLNVQQAKEALEEVLGHRVGRRYTYALMRRYGTRVGRWRYLIPRDVLMRLVEEGRLGLEDVDEKTPRGAGGR
jgi:hypothetical protein